MADCPFSDIGLYDGIDSFFPSHIVVFDVNFPFGHLSSQLKLRVCHVSVRHNLVIKLFKFYK